MKDRIVLRFSNLLGVLPAEDLAGEPIYLSVNSTNALPTLLPEEEEKKKKKIEGAIYNIPGKGNVTVSYKGKEYFKQELPITQFGNTEVLVDGLFNKKINTKVIFSPQTGAIVKIDKD